MAKIGHRGAEKNGGGRDRLDTRMRKMPSENSDDRNSNSIGERRGVGAPEATDAMKEDDAIKLGRAASNYGQLECISLDLEDLNSIRKFCEILRRRRHKVRCLVNNAAVMGVGPDAMGVDRHLKINHVGTFALSRFLLPMMACRGRIVTVGSEAHRRSRLPLLEDLELPRLRMESEGQWWYTLYARSKLANQLMTVELQYQLRSRGSSVTAWSASPVATNVFDNIIPGWLHRTAKAVIGLALQSPEQGARGVLIACDESYFDGVQQIPSYIHVGRICAPSLKAQDQQLTRKLWEATSRHIGLTKAEEDLLWPDA